LALEFGVQDVEVLACGFVLEPAGDEGGETLGFEVEEARREGFAEGLVDAAAEDGVDDAADECGQVGELAEVVEGGEATALAAGPDFVEDGVEQESALTGVEAGFCG
jgi:hypothetical protein